MLLSNNTIHGGEGTNAYAYNSGAFKAPQLDANILFSASSGNHYGFYENHASSVEPNPMRKNNIFNLSGAGTFYFYRDADANGMCHTGGVSSAGNCASIADMEADLNAELTGTPAINNFNFDNSGNQLFQNVGDMLENGWEIKSTAAVVINFGLNCPGEYSVKTFLWGEATSQSECNEKFPGVGSNYNSGNCENTYLYPAVEINSNGLVTGNGLCESGEICLMNPNVGAYAGHGALVDGGCDVSGLINDVSLLRYGTNGR